jgi:hypothetical protein
MSIYEDSWQIGSAADLDSRITLVLGYDHLLGELVPQLRDVGDDADHPAAPTADPEPENQLAGIMAS